MLLRSSSTPLLGSLISSLSESPNNFHRSPSPYHHHQTGSFNFATISCNSSPISPSGLRRAQSDSNLEGLALGYDDCQNLTQPKKILGREKWFTLETIPSFSIGNSGARFEEEDDDDCSEIPDEEEERFEAEANASSVSIRAQVGLLSRSWNAGIEGERGFIAEEIYIGRGLEIDNNGDGSGGGGIRGGGGGGGFYWTGGGGDGGGERRGTEEYFKMMVHQNPGNPLVLRNYAQFLYQTKRDLLGAHEYYSRAILADPEDGEILSQYAKVEWELNGDEGKASSYHELAIQASPQDCHVHAAYASFLWEIEEDEEVHSGVMASSGV
ncbi:hypothetical protein M5689_019291 [Euphorbia peplus]|nr:hypothetical protein M5689_019291 [Euphorbia peplus]